MKARNMFRALWNKANDKLLGERLLPLTLCLSLLLTFACSSIDCPLQNVVYTAYTFHKADMSPDTLKDTMFVVSFRADGSDTVLYNSGIGATYFTLPIGYSNPEDTLYFLFFNNDYEAIDTVWIAKENYPHFESVDCSASFFHELTAVRCTHNAIDSIVINNKAVTYDATTEHFHLYLKARD